MSKIKIYLFTVIQSFIALLILPSIAFAVGFGNLSVNSKLGETLNIEVDLLSVTPAELGTMTVSLASRSDFTRAGVSYPENAALLKFEIVEGNNGDYFVAITSDNPINDTFLHILLEANWSGGKVVREYTALLDPPLYTGDTAAVVDVPSTTGQSEVISSSELAATSYSESSESLSGSSINVQDGDTLSGIVNRLNLPDSISMYQGLTALLEANPNAFINDNMNRLRAGTTLTVPSFSNIAQISKGVALQNFQSQVSEYNQYLTSIGYGSSSDDTSASFTEVTSESSNDDQVVSQDDEAVDPVNLDEELASAEVDFSDIEIDLEDVEVVSDVAVEEDATLSIGQNTTEDDIASALTGDEGDDAQVSALKSQLAQLDESLLASGVESDEVKQRLQEIQAQVDRVSRLIEIEDVNLASSEIRASTGEENSEEITDEDTDLALAAVDGTEQIDDGDEAGIIDSENSGSENATLSDDSTASDDSGTDQASEVATTAQVIQEQPAQAAEETVTQSNDQSSDQTSEQPSRSVVQNSIMDSIFGIFGSLSDHALKILAAIIAIIAGLFFYRRRKSQQEFEESMLDIESGQISASSEQKSFKQLSAASGIDLASGDSGLELTIGGMSYLSEEAVAGVTDEENEVLQSGAVDPLAEADVYLAYDRDEQAIQVLKEAYSSNPERDELAEKLLEIYHKQDDRAAFDALAAEFKQRIGAKQHPTWPKIVSMGLEVSPDNSLYDASAELPGMTGAGVSLDSGDSDVDIETDLNVPAADKIEVLDLSADELDLASGNSEESVIKNLEVDDFELPQISAQSRPDRSLDAPTLSQIIDAVEAEKVAENVAEKNVLQDIESERSSKIDSKARNSDAIEFNLGELDDSDFELELEASSELATLLDMESDHTEKHELPILSEVVGEVASDLSDENPGKADIEQTAKQGAKLGDEEINLDSAKEDSYLSELSEESIGKQEPYHESETALELAKAYLELGEKDIAKGFIEEVINEGSDKQKAKAEKLVKELVD